HGRSDIACIVPYLSVRCDLLLSIIIIIAIARQKTHQVFQNHVLLSATFLLVGAVILNILINVYTIQASGTDVAAIKAGVLLSKRVQGMFDYLFGITIGAFIVLAPTPA